MNGGVIPHHRQAAYDQGRDVGWFDGYHAGRRDRLVVGLTGFVMGLLAAVASYAILGWFS